MGGEWRTARFEDLLLEPVRNGIYKKKEFHGRGAKIVNMGELFRYPRLSDVEMKRVELTEKEVPKVLLQSGDLLFARRSLTAEGAGKCSIVREVNEDTTFESSIIRARPNPELADSDFLYYLYCSEIGYNLLDSIRRSVAVSGITGGDLKNLELTIPPLPEQKAIAHILGTLDDKIELNRRMNATLEGMAQALFKSWFVDFDPVIDNALAAGNPIPDELAPRARLRQGYAGQAEVRKKALASSGEPSRTNGTTQQSSVDHPTLSDPKSLFPAAFQFDDELGWIPEGWAAKKIEDCISRFSAGKKYSQKTAEDVGCVPILDQGKSGVIGYHNDVPGVKASTDDPIIVFANHTCYMRLIQFDFSAIQNVLPYKGNGLNIYWIYEATKGRQDFIEYKGHWPDFVLNRIVVPSIDLVDVFGDLVEASYRKIYANTLENEGLTKIRDTLLPKLISGDLRIPNNEKLRSA